MASAGREPIMGFGDLPQWVQGKPAKPLVVVRGKAA